MNCQSKSCQCVTAQCADSTHAEQTSEWMSLSDVARKIPRRNGKRVNTSTIWRWCRKGVRGVHLKYAKIGRTIAVNPSDLQTFFTALAETDKADRPSSQNALKRKPRRRATSTTRQRQIDEANKVLVRAGILKPQTIDYKD